MQFKSSSTVYLVVLCLFVLRPHLFAESIRTLDNRIQTIETQLKSLPVREPGESGGSTGLLALKWVTRPLDNFVTVDLEAVYPIDHIALVPTRLENAERLLEPAGFPIRFEIQGSLTKDFSDPVIFFDAKNEAYPDPNGYPVIFAGKRQQIRFLRMIVHEAPVMGMAGAFSIAELFIFSNGRNVALRKPVQNSRSATWKDRFRDDFLVDGQTSLGQPILPLPEEPVVRGWHAALKREAACNETVEMVFEHAHEIDEIHLYPVYHTGWPDGTAYGFPVNFKVQVKEENSGWITVEDWSQNPFPSPGNNPVYISLNKRNVRAVRLLALRLPQSIPTQHVFAMAEMEVYADGTNIAPLGKITTSSLYGKHPEEWNVQALVDGYGTKGKIIPVLSWLESLAQRGQLEAELAVLIEQRTQQQEKLARTLRIVVLVLVGALLLSGAIMIRNKLRRRKLLQQLQNEIASDLHDDVGSNLASIAILAAGTREQCDPTSPQAQSLQRMVDITKETSSAMHDIVWMLHPDRKTNMSLTSKLQDIAGNLLAEMTFSLADSEEVSASQLSMDKLHHFLLFYKEVLHNLAKHSNASQVDITLRAPKGTIRLKIIDNGIPPSSGFLPNGLKRRADKMNAILSYQVGAQQNQLILELS